jgi:predicted nucleic acid-binding protein
MCWYPRSDGRAARTGYCFNASIKPACCLYPPRSFPNSCASFPAKNNFSPSEIEAFYAIILETAALIEPAFTLDIIDSDPGDNRILKCAVAAACDYIITGDKHLLSLKIFEGISIITPEDFISLDT